MDREYFEMNPDKHNIPIVKTNSAAPGRCPKCSFFGWHGAECCSLCHCFGELYR